jgi:hypothetical protein
MLRSLLLPKSNLYAYTYRLKEALPNFCIFLSGNESNRVIHDKNSISILKN